MLRAVEAKLIVRLAIIIETQFSVEQDESYTSETNLYRFISDMKVLEELTAHIFEHLCFYICNCLSG